MYSLVDRRALLIAMDVVTAAAVFVAGVMIRFGISAGTIWEQLELPPIWLLASSFAALTFASFAIAGVYRSEIYWDLRTELSDLAKGVVLLGLVSLAFLYLFKLVDVSRIAIAVTFGLLVMTSITTRLIVRSSSKAQVYRGEVLQNWLIVGGGDPVDQLANLLSSHPHVGAGIVGFVSESNPMQSQFEWLGTLHDLPTVLRSHVIDEVIVSGVEDQKTLQGVLSVCAEQGKTVRLAMDSVAPTALKGRMEEYDGIPMWSILSTPEHSLGLALKRLIDVVGASLALAVLSPLLIGAALKILIVDGRPILYKQLRGGLHGREFTMLKFRTMVNGAETLRDHLLYDNERTGPAFKITEDPRVTRSGRWLRRSSLDETPQLINVLLGQMSLVGPRPQPLIEVDQYDLWHRRRLAMRPGITGLWQIRARNDRSFDTWMDNDLEYIDRWTLTLDFSILLRTPRAVIRLPGD